MKELSIITFDNQQVVDSREVAEMIGKQHKNLIRDIERYIHDLEESSKLSFGSTSTFFIPSTYELSNGRKYKRFLLTKQGCEFVANKMTGKKGNQFTAQYVTAFNQMQTQISQFKIPKTLPEALRLAADQAEKLIESKKENQKLTTQLREANKKVDYLAIILKSPEDLRISQIAADYGMSGIAMNKLLKDFGVQHKVNGQWILYKAYMGKGYVDSHPDKFIVNGKKVTKTSTMWTQAGRKLIYDILKENGILPLIERKDIE